MTTAVTQSNVTEESKPVVLAMPDFGKGRYSPLMEECYKDAHAIFRLEPAKAEQLARNIANEFGAWMATKAPSLADIKISKLGKDGKLTLTEAASKIKGATQTPALLALRALKFANEAMSNGVSRGETAWKPNSILAEYFQYKL